MLFSRNICTNLCQFGNINFSKALPDIDFFKDDFRFMLFSKKKKCHIQALWVTVASGGIVTSFTNPVSDI